MSKQRVLLGISIIAGGACASLPFLRETSLTLPIASQIPAPSVNQAWDPLLQRPGTETSPESPSSPQQAALAPSPYLDDGSERLERDFPYRSSISTAPPEIVALPQEESIAPPLLPVSFQVKKPDADLSSPWQPARMAEGPSGPPREYRIRKLDSLDDLAERFLGSRDRAEELFAANRGVLQDRHILPLGAVIRIPSDRGDSETEISGSDLQPVRPAPER